MNEKVFREALRGKMGQVLFTKFITPVIIKGY